MPLTDFNGRFETWWNFEADKTSFEKGAKEALDRLFEVAAFYTPFDEDRRVYPGYTYAADVLDAANAAYRLLKAE
jgi:hypothetical protein